MTWADAGEIFLRIFLLMGVVIAMSRVFGLRSFSKLSGFDFAVTVAMGSVVASGITALDKSPWIPAVALLAIFVWQMLVAPLRTHFRTAEDAIDNHPLMVMENGDILEANLHKASMTRADLWAKLRDANVGDLSRVQAAVVEVTGVFTVLHGHEKISDELLDGVRR
ncbi:hypothetical protein OCH239_05310 [Roseivivax halodurans JCM 10272]|uniref:YetF C-terminal domain-containing protein n=1 Tax=Roseivivax halodurans JCM 10272 TaxID=1449350 RepID=X7ED98_9RHOB|nr:YetF domain-containing protein [Roseivivax halodurans]ETX14059.1 hypothetical protein OCH239_05310 [Roseivivax halodurans JCM 10272]